MVKKIPIGISDFKKLITENYYFIDKSLLIKDIVEDGAEVILIPRPRRFGKTLNMSMLRYFFESTRDGNSYLFQGLKINDYENIMNMQGKYPVIFLTFKDEKYLSWEKCEEGFSILLSNLYKQFEYLLSSAEILTVEKNEFKKILNKEASIVELSKGLLNLSSYLYKYHKTKVFIFIDEYDVPIQEGYMKDYYSKIIEFMRIFLSGGLKDNPYLEKAVLTGILRVAKESVFSGLNNLEICSILINSYSGFFGFKEEEVEKLCEYYSIESAISEIKKWYNG
jgi:hypothetical protein